MQKLKSKLLNKKFTAGIIGLGYIGLPLFLELFQKKINVYGFDINPKILSNLKKKKSHITEISNEQLTKTNKNRFINLLNSPMKIKECDVIIFCLPTPIKKNKKPDMDYIINAFQNIKKYLRKEQMIILESTVYPGATEDIFLKFIKKNFNIGKDFYLSYSPERVDPGTKRKFKFRDITKVVSGYTQNCLFNSRYFYSLIFKNIFVADSIRVAEFAKCFENTYRSININLVNQMKIISQKIGLDFFHIIDVAKSKPFGFVPFLPGPGIGGHCIPVDPLFISWIAKKQKVSSSLIDAADKINLKMPEWIFKKIAKKIKKTEKILILGITYKKDVNDLRESSAIKLFKLFKDNKYNIFYYDPYITSFKIKNFTFKRIKNFKYNILKKFKNVILLTDHSSFNYNEILKYSNVLYDTRGVYYRSKKNKVISC
tara:strand:- start:8831 stop:10114 length:1284 start_codon:yes stop_codon:yes gene_type:complete